MYGRGLGAIYVEANGGSTPAAPVVASEPAPHSLPAVSAPAPTQDPSAPPSTSGPAPLIHPILAPLISDGGGAPGRVSDGLIHPVQLPPPILVAERVPEIHPVLPGEPKKAAAKTATAGVGGPLGLLLLLGLAGALVKGSNV